MDYDMIDIYNHMYYHYTLYHRRIAMNRTIQYTITEKDSGLRIEQFLRRRGYSGQNLAEIKRMPKSILVNGVHYYMRQILTAGDILQVIICETKNSEKIPPVEIPLDIIYEDEDIIVINKPAGMPIHPSMNNYFPLYKPS